MTRALLITLCLGLTSGILFRSFFIGSEVVAIIAIATGILFLAVFQNDRRKKYALLFLYFSLALGVGVIRFSVGELDPAHTVLDDYVNKKGEFIGIVCRDPEVKNGQGRFVVCVEKENVETKILVSGARGNEEYGDRILVKGTLKIPEGFNTDTGRVFDYRNYLGARGIWYELSFAERTIISRGEGNSVVSVLYALKHISLDALRRHMSFDESAITQGMLVGTKNEIEERVTEAFRATGLIHLLVLSGYNILLVILALSWVCARLPHKIMLGVVSLGTLLFVVMVGAEPPAVRALIMAFLVLLARTLGRKEDAVTALFLAGAGMALFNPYLPAFDPSYQLSFLATLGIIVWSDHLARIFMWLPEKILAKFVPLREIVVTTVAALSATTPLLLFMTETFPVYAILMNILVVPFVPLIMLGGMVLVISSIIPFLSLLIGTLLSLLVGALKHIVFLGAELPYATVHIEWTLYHLGIAYMLIIMCSLYLMRKYTHVIS